MTGVLAATGLSVSGAASVGGGFTAAGGSTFYGGMTLDGVDVGAALATAQDTLLVNGGLEIWQRGVGAFTTSGTYGPDRWLLNIGAGSTLSLTRDNANQDTGSQFCASCVYTHAVESYLQQLMVEEVVGLRGRTLTFSARVRTATAGAARLAIYDSGTGAYTYGAYHTGSGAYQTLAVTLTVSATATNLRPSLALGASCTAFLDSATLVVGNPAPAFVPLSPTDDWLRCWRYYQVWGGINALQYIVGGQCYSTTRAQFALALQVPMAGAPTVTVSAAGDFGVWSATATNIACTALSASIADPRSVYLDATVASGLVAGDATILHANSTTAARIFAEYSP